MNNENKIGARIKMFRERIELTTGQLAQNSGVDLALVNAIEAGEASPSIGVLVKLSRALGQRLGTFMDGEAPCEIVLSKLGVDAAAKDAHGRSAQICHYVPLAAGKTDRHMEPLYLEMLPAPAGTPTSSHEGEEFLLVLEGEMEVKYGQNTHRVKKGETIYYNSVVPHLVAAAPGMTAKVCAVVYTPA
jgi:transcriptional regulator with XRE-family HTH domain